MRFFFKNFNTCCHHVFVKGSPGGFFSAHVLLSDHHRACFCFSNHHPEFGGTIGLVEVDSSHMEELG